MTPDEPIRALFSAACPRCRGEIVAFLLGEPETGKLALALGEDEEDLMERLGNQIRELEEKDDFGIERGARRGSG